MSEPVGAGGERGLGAWWRSLGRGQRAAVVVVGAIVAINVGFGAAESVVGSDPGGPSSSSFSTGEDGLGAYADLLEADGRSVVRLTDDPADADLPPDATVVVADPGPLSPADAEALVAHASGGGRLVLAGGDVEPLVDAIAGAPVAWSVEDPASELRAWVPDPALGGATEVAGDGGARWGDPGPLLALAGDAQGAWLLSGPIGSGQVLALAQSGPLHNDHLAEADNAALGLGLAGGADRPVVFVESVHGYGDAGGLAAVPSAWKWAALGLAIALLAGLWSAGARFGPAEPDRRALRPPRRDHVDAIAADLERVSPVPADLADRLARGRADAAAARRDLGLAPTDPAATVATDPHRGGDPS